MSRLKNRPEAPAARTGGGNVLRERWADTLPRFPEPEAERPEEAVRSVLARLTEKAGIRITRRAGAADGADTK